MKVAPARTSATTVWAVDRPPAVLGSLDELERHGQPGRPRTRPPGDLGPVSDGGEGRLDRVGTEYERPRGSAAWCSAGPAAGVGHTVSPSGTGALEGTRMGRPFLHAGLRARVSSWPPLRLIRLRCARVSVGVVPSQRFPIGEIDEGRPQSCAISGWMCTGSSPRSRWSRTGWSVMRAGSGVTPAALREWAGSLRLDDQVALEATGNSDAIAQGIPVPVIEGLGLLNQRHG